MKHWPVAPFFDFLYHFWLGLLLHPTKSDKKNEKKGQLARVSFFRSVFLQNPYFRRKMTIHIFFFQLATLCWLTSSDVKNHFFYITILFAPYLSSTYIWAFSRVLTNCTSRKKKISTIPRCSATTSANNYLVFWCLH